MFRQVKFYRMFRLNNIKVLQVICFCDGRTLSPYIKYFMQFGFMGFFCFLGVFWICKVKHCQSTRFSYCFIHRVDVYFNIAQRLTLVSHYAPPPHTHLKKYIYVDNTTLSILLLFDFKI